MAFAAGVTGAAAGFGAWMHGKEKQQAELRNYGDKYYEYFQLLNRWMTGRNEGKTIADFFHEEHIGRIAIYGMGELANRMVEELKDSDIQIVYGIDRDVCNTNSQIADVYAPDDTLPEADAVVITPFLSAEAIRRTLAEHCPYRMIALDDVIYSL